MKLETHAVAFIIFTIHVCDSLAPLRPEKKSLNHVKIRPLWHSLPCALEPDSHGCASVHQESDSGREMLQEDEIQNQEVLSNFEENLSIANNESRLSFRNIVRPRDSFQRSARSTSGLHGSNNLLENLKLIRLNERGYLTTAERTLDNLLNAIVETYLYSCDFLIIADKAFQGSRPHQTLLRFPNFKQTVYLQLYADFLDHVEWEFSGCRAVFFLLSDPGPLIRFGDENPLIWCFFAKVIILGLNEQSLTEFVQTRKGRKTQHIVGIVKGDSDDHLKIFMNLLFWGNGLEQISNWREDSYTGKVDLFPIKVTNLRQFPLQVGTFEWLPAIFYERDEEGHLVLRYGRDPAIVQALSEIYNFTIEYVQIPEDEIFGAILPNGSFNGLVGYFERDEIHMGVANLYAASVDGRDKYQDYSHHTSEDRGCFLARVDPPLPKWQNPSLPFKVTTWLAFFCSLLLSGPLFYIIATVSSKLGFKERDFRSFSALNLYSFGVHFAQPMYSLPLTSGMQAFALFMWFYGFIITTGYTSNLIAFLTVSTVPKSIETIEDLAQSGLKVITLPFYASQIRGSGNPHLQALVDNLDVRYVFEDVDEVLAGDAAELNSMIRHEMNIPRITTSKGKVLVRLMRECFLDARITVGFPVNSPLKPTFNIKIARLFESGVITIWYRDALKYYKKLQDKKGRVYYQDDLYDEEEGLVPLGMDHMQGIFIIFLFGCALSSFAFGFEMCCVE